MLFCASRSNNNEDGYYFALNCTASGEFNTGFGDGSGDSTVMPVAGTFTLPTVITAGEGGPTGADFVIGVNGTDTSCLVHLNPGQSYNQNNSVSVHVNVGDEVYWVIRTGSSGWIVEAEYSILFTPD